jgi:DNA-binding Lrp family transcriptional regulator
MVHLSSQGVKNRILKLLRLGLLKRETIKREDGTTLIRFMITRQAKETLKERKAI